MSDGSSSRVSDCSKTLQRIDEDQCSTSIRLHALMASATEISAQDEGKSASTAATTTVFEALSEELSSEDADRRLAALVTLRDLVVGTTPRIEELLDAGMARLLVRCLEDSSSKQGQLHSAWVITNIVAGGVAQSDALVQHGLFVCLHTYRR